MTTASAGAGRPLRVAFVLTHPDAVGGTERATYQLTAELARRTPLDVSVLGIFRERDVPHFHNDVAVPITYLVDLRDGSADTAEVALRVPSELVDAQWDASLSAHSDARVREALAADPPDVVVASTPAQLALLCQVAPAGTAVIGAEHRASATRGVSGEPLHRFGNDADAFVSLTPDGSEWFARVLGPDHPRLAAIPTPLPDAFRPRASCTQPVVVAAGRMVRTKRFGHVVRAFADARRPGWRLRIFGDGPERDALHRLVIRLGIHDHVDLVPFVPELQHELAKASMLVMSSVAEGLPLVALEAIATGIPVVSYDCPVGPRAIIEPGVNGVLVPTGDVDGLARAIRSLIDDADLRVRLGEGALQSRTRFDAATIAQQWFELITDVAAAGPRRARRRSGSATVVACPRADQPWVPRGGLLVHIGPHKTGTTAVQAAFSADRAGLARLGVVYPGTTAAPHGAVMSRLGTHRGWYDAIEPGPLDAWDELCVETRTAVGTVVVSSEAFCHATDEQARAIGRELRHGPTRVVVTLRALEQILPSSWQEYVKSGWTTTFDEFLRFVLRDPTSPDNPVPTFWIRQDHGRLVRRWADAVGADNVTVVVADPARRAHLVEAFEDLLGLPGGTLRVDPGATNRSLSGVEVELLRRLNVAVRDTVPWRRFNRLLRLGGTATLVEARQPRPDEPRLVLPGWATACAREIGAAAVEEIRSTRVRVEGDLDFLVPSTPFDAADAPADRDADVPVDVPVDVVVELLEGVLRKMQLLDAEPA